MTDPRDARIEELEAEVERLRVPDGYVTVPVAFPNMRTGSSLVAVPRDVFASDDRVFRREHDLIVRAEAAEARVRWAYETLLELNPSNYNHDDVCRLNDASVEVILGLKPYAAPPLTTQRDEIGEAPTRRVRHKKRGSTYRVLGEAEAQVSYGRTLDGKGAVRMIEDGDRLTVYRAEDGGKLWVRFSDEFGDGRFEEIGEDR